MIKKGGAQCLDIIRFRYGHSPRKPCQARIGGALPETAVALCRFMAPTHPLVDIAHLG